ncbi:prenyltransferase/squalene oxidase repeat-containing protein [Hathewaya histolytica]|uniref:Surface/cell-adhesion protein n=1 Tax=Hathewaya histolytica TaxID=1498 RepID=A0A4U9QXP3_HATHI|nr:prenyltransferase/squalene oxidase repeat-containing protein [Hathewaya histolytica]VTQ83269.1 surface/cell-adhesion protein [Hathewaya histolytica]
MKKKYVGIVLAFLIAIGSIYSVYKFTSINEKKVSKKDKLSQDYLYNKNSKKEQDKLKESIIKEDKKESDSDNDTSNNKNADIDNGTSSSDNNSINDGSSLISKNNTSQGNSGNGNSSTSNRDVYNNNMGNNKVVGNKSGQIIDKDKDISNNIKDQEDNRNNNKDEDIQKDNINNNGQGSGNKEPNKDSTKDSNNITENKKITPKVQDKDIIKIISKSSDYLKTNNDLSNWDVIALKVAGQNKSSQELKDKKEKLLEYIEKEIKDEGDDYGLLNYSRSALAVLSQDGNPYNFKGTNLVSKIKNMVEAKDESINAQVWGMMVLDILGESYKKEEAIQYLAKEQKSDGGFALFSGIRKSDNLPDITAMTVYSLTMGGNDKNHPIVKKALEHLKVSLEKMNKDKNSQNLESLAQIVMAIVASGDDLSAYTINNQNILDEILTYKVEDGSFKHNKSDKKGNKIATEQALIALSFKKDNINSYVNLRPSVDLPKDNNKGEDNKPNDKDKEDKEEKEEIIDIKVKDVMGKLNTTNGGTITFSRYKNFEKVTIILFDNNNEIKYINDIKLGVSSDNLNLKLDKGSYKGVIKLQGSEKVKIPNFEIE